MGPTAATALPLASRPVIETTSLECAREHISAVFMPHRVFYRGSDRTLHLRHHRARLGSLGFNYLQYGGEVTVDVPELGFYLLQLTLDGGCVAEQANRVATLGAETLYVVNPDHSMRKDWRRDCRQLIVRVERAAVERTLAVETGVDVTSPVDFAPEPLAATGSRAGLAALLRMLADDLDREAPTFGALPLQRQAESMLVSALLHGMPHTYSWAFGQESAAAPFYIRRAEEFMRAHAAEAITMEDLAAASGASVRSLQAGFRRFRGTSPRAWLRDLRLDLARERLLAGEAAGAAARRAGFHHLGRFAEAYRRRFGESPSQTQTRRGG